MDGIEPLRLLGVVAQLGAKVLHVAVDGALIALKVVAENLLNQLHTVVDTTGMTSKRGEQLKLGSGQVHFLVLDQNLVARDIDDQIAEVEYLDGGLVGLMGTAEQSANARNKLARRERLDQIVVGSELEADNTVFDLALGGKHDNRHIRGVANGAANALTGNLREHEVEHDQVELMLLELLDSRLAVAHAHNPIALALEIGSDSVTDCLLILDQQNLFCI